MSDTDQLYNGTNSSNGKKDLKPTPPCWQLGGGGGGGSSGGGGGDTRRSMGLLSSLQDYYAFP